MSKYKALKKDEVEYLSKEINNAVEELDKAVDYKTAFISIGYAKSKLNIIIKQLKGEFPMI